LGIQPEDVKVKWEDNDVMTQALIIAYSHVRGYEDDDSSTNMLQALLGSRLA